MMRTLIKGATVVTMDAPGDLPRADILVEDGVIAAIGTIESAGDATVIEAGDCIALPGLIDAHNCVWQTLLRGFVPNLWTGEYFTRFLPLRQGFAAEDLYASEWIGGCEMLSYGVTTVVDYCHNIRAPEFADAALQGLRDSGIRHLFTYSLKTEVGEHFADRAAKRADARRVFEQYDDPDTLTGIHFGIAAPGDPEIELEFALARDMGVRNCTHINPALGISDLDARGLLGSDTLVIHGNLITNAELDRMAEVGMTICFTPSADIQGTPADVVRRAMTRGVRVLFGCDIACHVASDTLNQLRIMFNIQGYLDGAMERAFSSVPGRRPAMAPGLPLLTPRELFRIATIETARYLGLEHRIGSLAVGKRADILLVRRGPFGSSVVDDPCAHVMLQTSPRDIDTVMVDGVVRVRDGQVVGYDRERAETMIAKGRARILG